MIPDGMDLGHCRMCGANVTTSEEGVVVEHAVERDSITAPKGLVAMHPECAKRLHQNHGRYRLHYTVEAAASLFLELRNRVLS